MQQVESLTLMGLPITQTSAQSKTVDSTKQAYYQHLSNPEIPEDFLLARTFRSGKEGKVGGIEVELAYLENEPGYIFANPTTVVSSEFASKTISQLPGNDWSCQPSLLFSVKANSRISIAGHGLASLNSFSSTQAVILSGKLLARETAGKEPLTFTQKMESVQEILKKNWTESINKLKEEIAALEEKQFSPAKTDKKVYKPFTLLFHAEKEYNQLLYSLEELYTHLRDAHNLFNARFNLPIKPHPLAEIVGKTKGSSETLASSFSGIQGQNGSISLRPAQRKKIARQMAQAVGSYKSFAIRKEAELREKGQFTAEHVKSKKERIQQERSLYEEYMDYIDTGARHNELVSRVYPWEITGIECGGDDSSRVNAVESMIVTLEKRQQLLFELQREGVRHPLFTDFMMNKLSLEHPDQSYSDLEGRLGDLIKEKKYLASILKEIKAQLIQPVQLYEYSPTKRELINISELIMTYRESFELFLAGVHIKERSKYGKLGDRVDRDPALMDKAERYNELFIQGLDNYFGNRLNLDVTKEAASSQFQEHEEARADVDGKAVEETEETKEIKEIKKGSSSQFEEFKKARAAIGGKAAEETKETKKDFSSQYEELKKARSDVGGKKKSNGPDQKK